MRRPVDGLPWAVACVQPYPLWMEKQSTEKKRSTLRSIWKLALAVVGVIAIVGELRKPPSERTWHGTVGGLIPYDFRIPTADRVRATYWNPDGPIISGKLWGVGWSPNFGAVRRLFNR